VSATSGLEKVKALITAGASVHARDKQSYTLLPRATGSDHAAVVRTQQAATNYSLAAHISGNQVAEFISPESAENLRIFD